jgi:hypothetical protein
MDFFEGKLNNSQWLTLAINIITIIVYSVLILKNIASHMKNRIIIHICLAILFIILYYTIREFVLLKDENENENKKIDITWFNVLYLALSAVNLIGIVFPPY